MKKLIFALFSLSISATCFSMNHVAGSANDTGSEKDMKWTTAKWYDSGDFVTKPLPSKPGPNDAVSVRWGSYSMTADCDVNVASFSVGDDSKFYCKKHNFKAKKNIGVTISPYGEALVEFTDSNVDAGGSLNYSFWDKHTKASFGTFRLVDSKANFKNDLVVIIPTNGKFKNPDKRGGKIELVGKSILSFGNGSVMDSIIRELPNEWMFRITFKEKDGNIPMLYFAKKADLSGCELEFEIKNVKSGTYTLVCFDDKKSDLAKPGRVVLNGKPYSIGDSFNVGGKSAKIMLSPSPTSKDVKTPNDLVLQVEK